MAFGNLDSQCAFLQPIKYVAMEKTSLGHPLLPLMCGWHGHHASLPFKEHISF